MAVQTHSHTAANATTSYFGFGEHENSKLDQVGLAYDMETCIEYSKSRGGEVCLPWVIVAEDVDGSGKRVQYGLFWNIGAYGGVDLGKESRDTMQWTGHNLRQVDVFLTTFAAGSDQDTAAAGNSILHHYVDAVGHAPPLPRWASGYWHSKNRYASQESVLETMETFEKNFSIPISVFVIGKGPLVWKAECTRVCGCGCGCEVCGERVRE